MKQTTPFQCFRKPAPESAAASGDTLKTDDRDGNIIETTENLPELLPYAVQKTMPMLS